MAEEDDKQRPASSGGGGVWPSASTDATMSIAQEKAAVSSPPRRRAEASSPSFLDSEQIAERYRIVRLLGEGGMGEVYEAEDLLLRERVALKTVRSDVAADPKVVERFKREIQIARRVTHPNVCRIF